MTCRKRALKFGFAKQSAGGCRERCSPVSPRRRGTTNYLYTLILVSAVLLAGLVVLLFLGRGQGSGAGAADLMMYCAAAERLAVEKIAADYQQEYGTSVRLQFGGSNTLLSQIEVARSGDLYLAADESYIEMARKKGLAAEKLPLARMRPVLAVQSGNPKNIRGLQDLLRDDVRAALGNPDQPAIGKRIKRLLTEAGMWEQVEKHVAATGVFKPTEPEIANDLKLGSVDVGIIWDSTAGRIPEVEAIHTPELDRSISQVTLGVLTTAKNPTAALHFARYVAARDRGLPHFIEVGFEPVDGDKWTDVPQLTFFAGAVNRRALEPIVKRFAAREGVEVNTVFNGCGILTGQMKTIRQDRQSGFPDMYMACDVYYLDVVADMFHDGVHVSNADIVIVVQKGNPKDIRTLEDLVRPGVRVAIGQPEQCTIGVLSRKLLESAGIYQQLLAENVVTQTPSSAMLVPNVTTGSADAVLAYNTDTLAERDKLEVIPIDSPLAKAVQPFSVARSSDYQHLAGRLFAAIALSRADFESAGFRWNLDRPGAPQEYLPAANAPEPGGRNPAMISKPLPAEGGP